MDRRFPVVPFDPEAFVPFFGKQTGELKAHLLRGGACNSNYLVDAPNGDRFVCRQYTRGNPMLEKSHLERVRDIVPTPEYLWVGENTSVMTYLEGTHFEPTPHLVREAGRMIGRLSRITFARSGQLLPDGGVIAFEGWGSFEEGLFALLHHSAVKDCLDEALIEEIRNMLHRQKHLLAYFDDCHSLVHGDFKPSNILVSEGRIVAILDWEFAHSGCFYMDMGNLLRHLPSHWENDLAVGLADEGVELPANWAFQASLIDLVSHLEFLTSDRSDMFKKACASRIGTLIQRHSELCDG